jgi:hypothetical protein
MRSGFCACLTAVLVLSGCASSQRATTHAGRSTNGPGARELRQRAERLWTARTQDDWAIVYMFEEPAERGHIDKAKYVDWHLENEPIKTHAFRLGRVQTEGDLGWVEVQCRTSARKFPNVPPRDVQRWEKWRVVAGDWYPIPPTAADLYPAAPALRDAAEEARLAARFEASFAARQARDWNALYALMDPEEHGKIPLELMTERENLYRYLSRQVQWVEVVGGNGRVRVRYETKRTDPSLTKMAPEVKDVTERWVKRGDTWYCRYSVSVQ